MHNQDVWGQHDAIRTELVASVLPLVELEEGDSEAVGGSVREVRNADVSWKDGQPRRPQEVGGCIQQHVQQPAPGNEHEDGDTSLVHAERRIREQLPDSDGAMRQDDIPSDVPSFAVRER